MLKHKLVDFIIEFMEEVDKEISEMKLFVCILPKTGVGDTTDLGCSSMREHVSSRKAS